jgi:hypothetical protein
MHTHDAATSTNPNGEEVGGRHPSIMKEQRQHTSPESCGVTCKGDVEALTGGSSRQGCESGWVKVPAPSIACIRTATISFPIGTFGNTDAAEKNQKGPLPNSNMGLSGADTALSWAAFNWEGNSSIGENSCSPLALSTGLASPAKKGNRAR